MVWTQENPGAGDPSGILVEGHRRSKKADALRSMQATLVAAQTQAAGAEWTAQSRDAFVAYLVSITPDVDLVISGLETQARALSRYSVEVDEIQTEQRVLAHRREEADTRLARNQRLLADSPPASSAGEASAYSLAEDLVTEDISVLDSVEVHVRELAVRRTRADTVCAQALESGAVLGANRAFAGGAINGSSSADLLKMMGKLSESDLAVLLATHPELIEKALAADSVQVKDWWEGLAEPGATELSPAQLALVAGAPAIIGALGGVPALARVAANRHNAAAQLAKNKEEIKQIRAIKDPDSGDKERLKELKLEDRYLKSAIDGEVQLYLFDRDQSRIIEMIGTPTPETTRQLTYNPGTFANMELFYNNEAQQVANYIVERDPNTVAFVYKDGIFPGDSDQKLPVSMKDGPGAAAGIVVQANSPEFAAHSGRKLATFEEDVSLDPLLAGVTKDALAHSWGLANVTSAETYGTHYDHVGSMSGAWMPEKWEPDPTTSYFDVSYNDLLQVGINNGVVGEGNNPRSNEAFEHGGYYEGPEKAFDRFGVPHPSVLYDNHLLVATDDVDNQKLLRDVEEQLRK